MSTSLKYWVDITKEKFMKLEKLRKEIDKIDENLVLLLGRRFDLVKKIALIKKKLNLPITDINRERQILERSKKINQNLDLNPEFIEKILKLIIVESKRLQNEPDRKAKTNRDRKYEISR